MAQQSLRSFRTPRPRVRASSERVVRGQHNVSDFEHSEPVVDRGVLVVPEHLQHARGQIDPADLEHVGDGVAQFDVIDGFRVDPHVVKLDLHRGEDPGNPLDVAELCQELANFVSHLVEFSRSSYRRRLW